MIISRRNSPTLPLNQLYLLGNPLQRMECYKYLGLLISSNMSWSVHITATCSKAKQILGLFNRCFYGSLAQILNNCAFVWFSHTLIMHARSGTLTLLTT